ncbi:MAG: RluA family pseudouridine synthase [Chloroflexi bacterium]|nr:RluA family pseudouridine synthase [Chloroflexota bacterium]
MQATECDSCLVELCADVAWNRLDQFLGDRVEGLSRAHGHRLIREGRVIVNGGPCKASQVVRVGDIVRIRIPAAETTPEAEMSHLHIVYEDESVLVVDKPAGMVVHPAPGHSEHTLVNAILGHYPTLACGEVFRPGIVHRLDKDTSGLIVVAKLEPAREWLVRQFKERAVHKEYLALVVGSPPPFGTIDAPIGRHPIRRKRMAVVATGRPARTDYTVLEHMRDFALVSAMPATGRTHQIRVHFESIGHPVAGDHTYGGKKSSHALSSVLKRQFLHAHRLALRLPGSAIEREFVSPLPPDLTSALAAARSLAQP